VDLPMATCFAILTAPSTRERAAPNTAGAVTLPLIAGLDASPVAIMVRSHHLFSLHPPLRPLQVSLLLGVMAGVAKILATLLVTPMVPMVVAARLMVTVESRMAIVSSPMVARMGARTSPLLLQQR